MAPLSADAWIIVVNWNGAHLLGACLGSLSRLTRPAHVAVVDNGSSDDSSRVVASFPDVEWIPLGRNAGFAAANNVGFRLALAAGARWVAIANTDVQLEPDWLERLIEAGEAHPEAGILGGLLLFERDPARVNSTGLTLDLLGRARDRDFDVPLSALSTRDGPVAGVSGGAALYRAEALRRTGLFDPAYFAYYEDVDLSLRAAALGIRCWYVSSARALHGYGRSFGEDSPGRRYLLARNHMRAMATHLPLARVVVLAPLLAGYRAAVKAPLELARGRPALARAHLLAAGAGALAALDALFRRMGGRARWPRGAEPG
jgi:hypothetical protein